MDTIYFSDGDMEELNDSIDLEYIDLDYDDLEY
jgi:hypothetical protein